MIYQKLFKIYENHPLLTGHMTSFKHVNESFLQLLLSFRFKKNNKNLIIVLPNLYDAQKYYDEISSMIDPDLVLFYPVNSPLTSLMSLNSPEFKNERAFTIRKLIENNNDNNYIIITTLDGLLKRELTKEDYQNSLMTIKQNGVYNLESLKKKLIYDGYQYNYTVERPGEFSVRGSIVDIFTIMNENPIRIDFFGDEVESIKYFDVITQRSINEIKEFSLSPLSEVFYTDTTKNKVINKINDYFNNYKLSEKEKEKLENDLMNINERKKLDTLSIYIPFINEEETTIVDFLNNYETILIEPSKIFINEETIIEDLNTFKDTIGGNSFLNIPFRAVYDKDKYNVNLEIEVFNNEDDESYNLKVAEIESFNKDFIQLKYYLEQYKDYTVILAINSDVFYEKTKIKLLNNSIIFNENKIIKGEVNLIKDLITHSFNDHLNKIILISDNTLLNSKRNIKIRYRSVINQSVKIKDRKELNEGDYIVHYNYGIGKYLGLKTMDLSGIKRDYLEILYSNDEKMFVPVEQIDLVLKYKAHHETPPRLSSLSSKTFSKTKANIKKRIKEFSDRLINLYAKRSNVKGFRFTKDSTLQKDFENDFLYQETIDQLKAINDVKADMELDVPMDRLIAGDVGYGKTEIALRAAFKAVMDGKQVAYLAPTTVLALQHYHTFKERFDKYGGNVSLLSRFVTKKEQSKILSNLKKGLVDIVIGTHRLLSEDIQFYDLGLFIIDEEQRFGVLHKEKIKEIKVNVDTLTLSATPIPRTLQMAIYGLKDLSMIETPPLNRYPVQTYVTPRNDGIIKEALFKELSRGGQVFYLYNRVASMPSVVRKLKALIPNAKIAHAHGKMSKDELELVLESFINKEYDILVSTTIIETGVDIPNTNTLIIHDADKLGLAQLYQLRGRVGRSDKIAYAYLMYDPNLPLNETSKKRLKTIEDFTDLGSGFKIALEDLSIRGAGDLLGEEQSGYIDSVGIDLYMKLLDEVVNKKEDETKETPNEAFVSEHIPSSYINYDPVRIEIHKRIANLKSTIEIDDFKLELTDRFGEIDIDVLLYMYEKLYKRLSYQLGVRKTLTYHDHIKMIIPYEKNKYINGLSLIKSIKDTNLDVLIKESKNNLEITLNHKNNHEHWLYLSTILIENYFKNEENKK